MMGDRCAHDYTEYDGFERHGYIEFCMGTPPGAKTTKFNAGGF
jgi:hypothetical protein